MTDVTAGTPARPAACNGRLARLLADDAIRSVYQPIVALPEGEVLGYEALARGPAGSPLEMPDALFAAAEQEDLLLELEWACRAAAYRSAAERLPAGATLFVNVEPASLSRPEPHELIALGDRAVARGPVVLELTERALTDSPSRTIDAVSALRARGFTVALDDVGVDPASIALLPFLQPEIVKLDMRLVRSDQPQQDVASVVHAVTAAAERLSTIVVAEGIETEAQQDVAQAVGAQLGQGWRFGRPALLPPGASGGRALEVVSRQPLAEQQLGTPFELVSDRLTPRVATKSLLLSMSKYLEHYIAQTTFASVLLATFQRVGHFSPRTQERYRQLGSEAAFVGVFGAGFPAEPVPGVRGIDLTAGEPLLTEWDVCAVTPHVAAALVARDLGDQDRPDAERRFAYCLTYDRDMALSAARRLMGRLTMESAAAPPA